jgi:alkylation response protein AidB-like acyl-CoA dehydrogenase
LHRATGVGAAPSVVVASSVDPIERRGQVLAAAVLTGITEWARNTASEHAVNRVQFDKPIGVNQAIKHPCADMAVQAQLAYAQVLFAALATDEARPDAEFHALTALLTAAGAAETATGATVQVLGGMGFTHEHDVHLYLKRAEIWALVFGPASVRLARLLDLPEPQ